MYCPHCSCHASYLPGWKHDIRPADAHGTIEHLWWGVFTKYGHRFGAGVSVKRNPLVDRHFSGTASLTWKLKRLPDSMPVEGLCTDVVAGALLMVGGGSDDFNMMTTWAAQLQPRKPDARKYSAAADEPVPF